MSIDDILEEQPGRVAQPIFVPAVSKPPKPDPAVNLGYSLGYLVGIALLMIPPLGILVLLIVHRKHKAYLKSFTNNSY